MQDYLLLERPGFPVTANLKVAVFEDVGFRRRNSFWANFASEGRTPTPRAISLAVPLVKRILPVRKGCARSASTVTVGETGLDIESILLQCLSDRSDGADVGGRAGVGRHRRAARGAATRAISTVAASRPAASTNRRTVAKAWSFSPRAAKIGCISSTSSRTRSAPPSARSLSRRSEASRRAVFFVVET